MASPVGEDNWVNYVDRQLHAAVDFEKRVQVVESFQKAVVAEPGSLKVWMAYCEYFWSLHSDCAHGSDAGWPLEEQQLGREAFTLDAALNLWQKGYEAVQYRLSDSHELWNRWVSLELEMLRRGPTANGVLRITHLFKDRLAVPHATWDHTSQMFSTFLSEYNQQAYESEMQQVTQNAKDAKRLYDLRDSWELKVAGATKSGDSAELKRIMTEYLEWEILQTRLKKDIVVNLKICLGLFSRALTGPLAADDDTWHNYLVLLSTHQTDLKAGRSKLPPNLLPNMLDVLQCAVHHVPWCGAIWARYILLAEEAGLSFTDIERIKHAATNSAQLDRDGMEGVLDMYSSWCGYLKRTAMNPNATEEAVDLAEVGLPTALEDVKHWGKRKYGDGYHGDPTFRLEKILIQFLTEKKEDIDGARAVWEQLSAIDIHANSYDFWLNWFLWEMVVFAAAKNKTRSPTPVTLAQGLRVPSFATRVFEKAVKVKTLDWPERIMEVYLKHCNDYELAETLREAQDTVYRTRKGVAKRRAREEADRLAQAAYAAQASTQAQDEVMADVPSGDAASPGGKRKRGWSPGKVDDMASKRPKSELTDGAELKRDRENTSAFVTNLPTDVTLTQIKHFFKGYGHVNNVTVQKPLGAPPVAHVEFASPEDLRSAMLKDGKYFDKEPVKVYSATGCTIFVTNYPPEFTEQDIRNLFKGCGEMHSIRFPSLKYNAKRRFCYITFRDPTFAAAATKLDGKLLKGGNFKLLAKYSDPPAKQGRQGAMAEERELHVLNLPHSMTEKELEGLFTKVGKVVSARVIRSMSGQSRGAAFVVMETKEEAQEAIKTLDQLIFGSHVIKVELSKPSGPRFTATNRGSVGPPESTTTPSTARSPSPGVPTESSLSTAADRAACKISVLGVPDTMNDAQLRRLLAPIEPIVKLVLHPIHSGAVVELQNAAAAGKAHLFVDGLEIEGSGGRKLRAGPASALFKHQSEKRIDRVDQPSQPVAEKKKKNLTPAQLMPPPPLIKRNQPVLGRGVGRAKIAFVGAAPKKDNPTTNGAGAGAASSTNGDSGAASSGKSNADFKKLFLSGGESEQTVKQEEVKNGQV